MVEMICRKRWALSLLPELTAAQNRSLPVAIIMFAVVKERTWYENGYRVSREWRFVRVCCSGCSRPPHTTCRCCSAFTSLVWRHWHSVSRHVSICICIKSSDCLWVNLFAPSILGSLTVYPHIDSYSKSAWSRGCFGIHSHYCLSRNSCPTQSTNRQSEVTSVQPCYKSRQEAETETGNKWRYL